VLDEMSDDAIVQPTQSMPLGARDAPRPRVLVDTNVWRYLIDLDSLESVYRAAKRANGVILACPAVLYEMLRLKDDGFRSTMPSSTAVLMIAFISR
jgi:hypothetical protein